MMAEIIQGNVMDVLRGMEAESVSCVVTSPPYWSLRKYDAADVVWGGEPECPHTLEAAPPPRRDRQHLAELGERDGSGGGKKHSTGEQYSGVPGGYTGSQRWQHKGVSRQETPEAWVNHRGDPRGGSGPDAKEAYAEGGTSVYARQELRGATCSRCGAWRGQYGLEPTPELYVEHTMMWLREVWRVLRKDGVLWLNLGDGYSGGHVAYPDKRWQHGAGPNEPMHTLSGDGLKPKDLVLMPFRVALAAQADGWWVRSVVIWSKPNAMPQSVTDRPTTAHEYVLMLTKSARYWYDQEAVREPQSESTIRQAANYPDGKRSAPSPKTELADDGGMRKRTAHTDFILPNGRNVRTVWTFPTAQTPEAHFATFPAELPRRCIEASCPREICAKCGTPRVRLVETKPMVVRNGPKSGGYGSRTTDGISGTMLEAAETTTLGWSDCACSSPAYQPGIVLDPFAGIGTTGVVARRLGRRFVGIELSEKYAAMAEAKLTTWWRDTRLVPAQPQEGQRELL